ncbi:MobV family relaxase [Prevotella multiformis]|uniref:Plasmid recombination enzyme n=1 Tax=Prevotella multiformis DSM 16608 TaxID=888743 RepID=F0F4L5_9BACT|nr:MobV family relaxase [Prevotella multiformis]EGC20891.1 plasmid recombination enzyme [Prevotella multiformis DSM 16608]
MGYAVLYIDKARSNDSAITAHIERTFVPNNVDATRTHLNRELVQFPAGVTNRTEAIEHRIATANIYRKVADNQVKALRFILSGSHEDMLRLESEGRLGEWCGSTMQWLYTTFGKENVVAATLHADEETPHIHATIVPIVQGERRKAKTKAENGKRKYKTKKDKVRLCADDVLTPKKLEEYQTTYAEQMRPFGLERGMYGSEAKHRSNMEYYKLILKETEQRQAEEAELIEKVRELEKQAGKLQVKGTLYSLFGNTELDKAEKRIEELEREMERQKFLSEKEKAEIRKEVILLQDTVRGRDRTIAELKETMQVYEEERNWIKRFFNGFYQLLNIRLMLRKMNFSDDRIAEMYRTEAPQQGTAKAYSGLYKREFTEEDSEIRIAKDEKKRPLLTINGLPITDWCELKWKQLIIRNRSQRL